MLIVNVFASGAEGETIDVRSALVRKFLETSQNAESELASVAEEGDGGYGDSVTDEAGERERGAAQETSSQPEKQVLNDPKPATIKSSVDDVKTSPNTEAGEDSFEKRLEEMALEVTRMAISQASKESEDTTTTTAVDDETNRED